MEKFDENSIRFSSENLDPVVFSDGGHEEIYEEIEAPKFVDFTSLGRYRPDDRYWFCLRVGCDQKHEEEMDSEAIYKRFVLRVMAARSPYSKLQKELNRNASRTPLKCPLSAPPKHSKPEFMCLTMKKMGEREKEVKTPLKSKSRPVASKYLTTPRNKMCAVVESSFRSVQNHKHKSVDVPRSAFVARALFSRSPEKLDKVKISLGCSSKSCKNLKQELLPAKIKKVPKDKSKVRGLVVNAHASGLSKHLDQAEEHLALDEHSTYVLPQGLSSENYGKENGGVVVSSEDLKVKSTSHKQTSENKRILRMKKHGTCGKKVTPESDGGLKKHLKGNNSCDAQMIATAIADEDDKENATASEANRYMSMDLHQGDRKILGIVDKNDQVQKVAKEVKLKKQKITNPKPFRLRTDERSILKEANLLKKATCIDAPKACPNTSKVHMKQSEVQIELKKTTASMTHENKKIMTSPQGNNAMQRMEMEMEMEMFNKATTSPLFTGIQRLASPNKKIASSYLIPRQKLETIHENSPIPKKASANSQRHAITVAREPNFHNTHVPRSCLGKPNN